MTSSSAYPSGTAPRETSNGSGEPLGPPSDAVTLNDLIADSGPLPPDAALECVQRLATLLDRHPDFDCDTLSPSDVLIDDDGEVWLTRKPSASHGDTTTEPHPARLDRLGRLLAFLATGENEHLSKSFLLETTSSPSPIATVAANHFAGNGACYQSYAELARDAAGLEEPAPPSPIPSTDGDLSGEVGQELPEPVPSDALVACDPPENALDKTPEVTEPQDVFDQVADEPLPESAATTVITSHEEPPRSTDIESTVSALNDGAVEARPVAEAAEPIATEEAVTVTSRETPPENSWLGIGVAVATAAGAAIAYVVWQFL